MSGGAMAFLKLYQVAGAITSWQFDNLVALTIQFCVLGYYRDHSRPRRPGGIYGIRMTGWPHRYIDLAIYEGVMVSSIGTGEEITREQFTTVSEACGFIGDLIDFRIDSMRKLRENAVLRGVRHNLCRYLDGLISCLQASAKVIRSSHVGALVVMGVSNWMLMSSQHKVYELYRGVREREASTTCEYVSASDGSYK